MFCYFLKIFILYVSCFMLTLNSLINNKNDLLYIYIYRTRTQEELYYFNKKLPSENNNSDNKKENNKIDKKNKENILSNNKIYIVLVKDKIV